MTKKEIAVADIMENYDNPIAELVQVACRFESEIMIQSNNRRINAKSIMGVMAFRPEEGMLVEISTDGRDEEMANNAMCDFLSCKTQVVA